MVSKYDGCDYIGMYSSSLYAWKQGGFHPSRCLLSEWTGRHEGNDDFYVGLYADWREEDSERVIKFVVACNTVHCKAREFTSREEADEFFGSLILILLKTKWGDDENSACYKAAIRRVEHSK